MLKYNLINRYFFYTFEFFTYILTTSILSNMTMLLFLDGMITISHRSSTKECISNRRLQDMQIIILDKLKLLIILVIMDLKTSTSEQIYGFIIVLYKSTIDQNLS